MFLTTEPFPWPFVPSFWAHWISSEHEHTLSSRLDGQWSPGTLLSHFPALGFQGCSSHLAFYLGDGNLNSCFMASPLLTAPPPPRLSLSQSLLTVMTFLSWSDIVAVVLDVFHILLSENRVGILSWNHFLVKAFEAPVLRNAWWH